MTRLLAIVLGLVACGGGRPEASTTPTASADAGMATSDPSEGSTSVAPAPAPKAKATCTSGGVEHEEGDRWPCPDGCNTCFCQASGRVGTTLQLCETRVVDAGRDAR
jgi:hypothetical protein